MVGRHGFREYYNPLNGEGLAAHRFGWSTLMVDLLPSGDRALGGPEPPFRGSVRAELLSMGGEAAVETARRLGARAVATRRRLWGGSTGCRPV